MPILQRTRFLLVLMALSGLSACSDRDSRAPGTDPSQENRNWDSMIWDKDDWAQ